MSEARCPHGIDRRFCATCSGTVRSTTLSEVLRFLNHEKIRATYGAVAEVLNVIPRSIGTRLGHRRPEASWVVSAKDGLPTDYHRSEMHPQLFRTPEVIDTGKNSRNG
jgi:hypothetical protein